MFFWEGGGGWKVWALLRDGQSPKSRTPTARIRFCKEWPSTEHYFQAQKFLKTSSEESRQNSGEPHLSASFLGRLTRTCTHTYTQQQTEFFGFHVKCKELLSDALCGGSTLVTFLGRACLIIHRSRTSDVYYYVTVSHEVCHRGQALCI